MPIKEDVEKRNGLWDPPWAIWASVVVSICLLFFKNYAIGGGTTIASNDYTNPGETNSVKVALCAPL